MPPPDPVRVYKVEVSVVTRLIELFGALTIFHGAGVRGPMVQSGVFALEVSSNGTISPVEELGPAPEAVMPATYKVSVPGKLPFVQVVGGCAWPSAEGTENTCAASKPIQRSNLLPKILRFMAVPRSYILFPAPISRV
jgi:hypothetical protein